MVKHYKTTVRFFNITLFTYVWLAGSLLLCGLFSSCGEWGSFSSCGEQASH